MTGFMARAFGFHAVLTALMSLCHIARGAQFSLNEFISKIIFGCFLLMSIFQDAICHFPSPQYHCITLIFLKNRLCGLHLQQRVIQSCDSEFERALYSPLLQQRVSGELQYDCLQ